MDPPSLKKGNNPYLDNDLLTEISTDTAVKLTKTNTASSVDSMSLIEEEPDDNKQNGNEDSILQSIMSLDKMDMTSSDYKPIKINVGGIKYESTVSTLCKYPQSNLSKLVANNVEFVDRDGYIFKYILNYLRDGVLILPNFDHPLNVDQQYLINQLLFESRFYGISSLMDELIMMKLESNILSKSSNNSVQKERIHTIRRLINEEYPKINKKKQQSSARHQGFNHEWKCLFKYNVSSYSSHISPSAILQSKASGLRSILMLFVAANQIFCIYFYEPWNEKAYRQKNFLYWMSQMYNDGLHKNKFANFTGKKFKCTYSYKGEIVAQYTPHSKAVSNGTGNTLTNTKSNTLNKDYQCAFSFDTSKQNTLILTNLKGLPMKALANNEKDCLPVSMLEMYHVALK